MNNEENNVVLENNGVMNNPVTSPIPNNSPVVEEAPSIVSSTPDVTPVAGNTVPVAEEMPTIINPVVDSTPSNNNVDTTSTVEVAPTIVDPSTVQPVTETMNNVVPRDPFAAETTEEKKDPNTFGTNNEGAVVNENLKKVEVQYTPPSKAKTIAMICLFVFLIAFIVFLPNITELVEKYQNHSIHVDETKITTGKMNCSLSTNTSSLDKNFDVVFRFTDNKLEKLDYTVTTRGDATLDEGTLDSLAVTCKQIAKNVESMSNVSIRCNYTDGKLVEIQSFDLKEIQLEELNAAYAEAGGVYPGYQYGQDMDGIEGGMHASGYTCERQ